ENGVTTYYIGKHYEERKGATVDEKTSYFFANSQRIAKSSQKNKAPPEVSYYLNNHLGSADVIIDEQGSQTDRLRYLPFGGYRTLPQERHTFTGKERDEVTDNYYFEARYYNPNIRRFTQADTIVPDLYDPQSLNRYAYTLNNPMKYIDPTGHNAAKAHLTEAEKAELLIKIEYQNKEIRKAERWSNFLDSSYIACEVVSKVGDMSLSILGGDVPGLVDAGAEAIYTQQKFMGWVDIDASTDLNLMEISASALEDKGFDGAAKNIRVTEDLYNKAQPVLDAVDLAKAKKKFFKAPMDTFKGGGPVSKGAMRSMWDDMAESQLSFTTGLVNYIKSFKKDEHEK
ncbi:MAG: RHS repeat-associated core domain-containing protein, partial [Candidatus Electrothrix sp. EH2]|nr:RHS repeat-associated core domain-containing protein [Candidatus Electrothrix sp. EH2]